MPIVAWIVTALGIFFRSKLGYLIAAALLWLGIGLTTYTVALQPTIDLLLSYAQSGGGLGGAGGDIGEKAVRWAGVLRLDQAITMWVSAIWTRYAVTSSRLFFTRVPGA